MNPLIAKLIALTVAAGGLTGCATSTGPVFPPQATLEEKLELTREHLSLPGAAVLVRQGDELLVDRAFGVASLETGEPMLVDHHFRIASITKPVVATVLLQLADEEKLSLDDPVSAYVEGVPNGDSITLRMLAQHTSGLSNYIAHDHVKQAFADEPTRNWTDADLLAFGLSEKPYFDPAEGGWMYSNTNYVLLGQVIESVENDPLNAVIQRRICRPLGLQDTHYSADGEFRPSPFARGYQYGDADGPIYWKGIGDVPYDVTDHSPSMWHAAGAMVSTLHDVDRLIRAIVDGELVAAESHAEQLAWRDAGYPVDYWYGLGLIKYHGNIGHNGNLPGYQTTAMRHPERDLTVVILTNMYSSPNYEEPADALFFVTIRHLTGQSVAPPGWAGW